MSNVGRKQMQGTAKITTNDVPRVTAAIFSAGNPIVSEAYSKFDEDIVTFFGTEYLNKYINQELDGGNKLLTFSVYYPDTQGFREVRKVALKPEKCNGHTYRYAVSGWGVIQFHLGRQLDGNLDCYFGVNSEKRANTWFATYPELRSPNLWSWQLVEKHVKRLSREIKKYAQPSVQAGLPRSAAAP